MRPQVLDEDERVRRLIAVRDAIIELDLRRRAHGWSDFERLVFGNLAREERALLRAGPAASAPDGAPVPATRG